MTQEEKQLLLKDLCARLPYGIRIAYKENEHDIHYWILCTLYAPHFSKDDTIIDTGSDGWIEYIEYPGAGMKTASRPLHLEKMLPFLRPMSSMTEEEKKYISDKCGFSIAGPIRNECELIMPVLAADWLIDFYNEHYIDYRGLIPMGLALEAPKGMYKTQ